MKGLLIADKIDKPTVPYDSSDVHESEWHWDPDVCRFQSRNPIEDEVSWFQAGAYDSMHNVQLQSMWLLIPINMSNKRR